METSLYIEVFFLPSGDLGCTLYTPYSPIDNVLSSRPAEVGVRQINVAWKAQMTLWLFLTAHGNAK